MESIMNLSVKELSTTPTVVDSSVSVSKAIGILKESDSYELFIEKSGKIGMVSLRDILSVKDILRTKISSLINYVPKLQPSMRVKDAARIMMDYRIRSLPIVENNKLMGQITILSILKAIKDKIPGIMKSSSIMAKDPITLKENDSVAKAKKIMIKKRIDHLPITSTDDRVTGVLTSSHIVFRMIKPERLGKEVMVPEGRGIMDFPAREFMDVNPLISDPNESVSTTLSKMIGAKKTCCLVKLWEELQGIITYRDYMKFLPKKSDLNEIPIYMIGLPEDPFEAEAAKIKFMRVVKFFKRSFSSILEARSNIKISSKTEKKSRHRYEVDVLIKTPEKVFVYSDTGWELPSIYDSIFDRIKRVVSQKYSKRFSKKNRSIRFSK
ncbi:MAG: CBS domain-containing protein [Candidatus Bathyarchaeia archaeon]